MPGLGARPWTLEFWGLFWVNPVCFGFIGFLFSGNLNMTDTVEFIGFGKCKHNRHGQVYQVFVFGKCKHNRHGRGLSAVLKRG